MVAYSSHSNFNELKEFVKTIKPGKLTKLVIEREDMMDTEDYN